MLYRKLLALNLAALFISGCTPVPSTDNIIANRDNEYLKAQSDSPLVIPPGLSSSKIQAHFPVPEQTYPGKLKKVDLIPPGL